MVEMMQTESCGGVRVGEVTQKTYLSRPAVSHHLQILKEAGILKVRKAGTKNFYYCNPDQQAMKQLISTFRHAADLAERLPKFEEN